MTKICSKCNIEKELKHYHKKKTGRLGVRATCKLCRVRESRERYKKNKVKIDAVNRQWAIDNREAKRIIGNRWNKNNRACVNFNDAKRRARKKNAFPKWLTDLQLSQIKSIYKKCAEYRSMGLNMHVDHVIPLQGKTVSGLHIPANLRIVTAEVNMRKGNTY
jgi:hypothetical protein